MKLKSTAALIILSLMILLCACGTDSNAVSRSSEYVSSESDVMDELREEKENQLADAQAALDDIQ